MAAQRQDELILCVHKLLATPYYIEILAFSEAWAKCWGCDGVTLPGNLL